MKNRLDNKLMHIAGSLLAILLLLCVGSLSATVFSSGENPILSYQNAANGSISLSFKLGEFEIGNSGQIDVQEKLKEYRIDAGGLPVFAVNLAIGNSEDYTAIINRQAEQSLGVAGQESKSIDFDTVKLGKPYIYRDVRGITLYISPFRINGDSLTAITELDITLNKTDNRGENPKQISNHKLNPYFLDNYKHLFLNFEQRYQDIAEYGSMLVICYDAFMNTMLPYVNWKNQVGIPTELVPVTVAGTDCETLKQFIQTRYDTDSTLTFVQLVGDHEQVPSLIEGENQFNGTHDPYYTLLEGDDYYPDIFVGRFSAENIDQLETQVTRTLEYEKADHRGTWLHKASGVCAVNPPTPGDDDEYNWDHLDNIQTKLLGFTYTEVDRVYANEGADTEDFAGSINGGKSLLLYCGEGYETYWITPYFNIDDVNELVNDNQLPFIQCVSCNTGNFYGQTCLAESFMRAKNEVTGEPTGAIGIYAAGPTQSVDTPMRSQDHFIDLLVSGQKNTLGGLCYNGSCNMLDMYPLNGDHNFFGWNLFGDASLQLRTAEPESIQINLSNQIAANTTSLTIQTGRPGVRVCLSRFDEIIASGFTDNDGAVTLSWSTPTQSGYTYLLTATGFNCLPFSRDLQCYAEGEGYLNVADITYDDNDDGVINPEEVISLQITVYNPSLVDLADVYIWFNNLSDYLDFSWGLLHLGNIAAGTDKQVQNYLRISRNCPDFRNLEYELVLSSNGQSWVTPCMITVHSPVVSIVDMKLLPEKNWLHPGEEIQVQYKIANTGSAAMKDAACLLTTDQPWIQILQSEHTLHSVPPGDTMLVTYSVRIRSDAATNVRFGLNFLMSPANTSQETFAEYRLVMPDSVMIEDFETNDALTYFWDFLGGAVWQLDTDAYEGVYSLKSPPVAVNSTAVAEVTFELQEVGNLVFYYKVNSASPQNFLQLYVNDTQTSACAAVEDWNKGECVLYPGVNKLSWRFERNGTADDSTACALIDAIQFPQGAIFPDALLETDVSEISITIHPEQVIYAPLHLSSLDGRYIEYDAVLQKVSKAVAKSTIPSLVFNRNNIIPGTVDRYIVTLYNPLPDREIREVRLTIPPGFIVTGASNFSLAGQPSLPRIGSIGSTDILTWMSEQGNPADSLKCVLSLMSDAYQHNTVLSYEINTIDIYENTYMDAGSIYLYTDGTESSFLTLTANSGILFEGESDHIAVKCRQELMPDTLSYYSLEIYNNGMNMHSIPVSVTYDPTPGLDTSKTSLRVYPNPFKDNLTIDYYLPEDGKAEISVYNIKGQKVLLLRNTRDYAGQNILSWNGKGKNSQSLPTGIYIIRLQTSAGKDKLTRCLLLK
jgi:hypothetical protein